MAILFRPPDDGKDLRVEYPELADIDEFADRNKHEMYFIWYYACSDSPLVKGGMDESNRILHSLEKSGLRRSLQKKDFDAYLSGNFPHGVKRAVNRMAKFKPTFRDAAKKLTETMFDNMRIILDKEKADIDKLRMDEKKDYLDMCIKAAKGMDDIVQKIEEGYGLTTQERFKKSSYSTLTYTDLANREEEKA